LLLGCAGMGGRVLATDYVVQYVNA
jgi:hypothetical protein